MTAYYYAGGTRIALAVNGTLSYLASDGLGSTTVALSATGSVQAARLFAPYGSPRSASGSMPGSYGYTGQHSDSATTGLDYYGARSYDPLAGQFTSADSLLAGLNRYAYVGGNPETFIDPSGHKGWYERITGRGVLGCQMQNDIKAVEEIAENSDQTRCSQRIRGCTGSPSPLTIIRYRQSRGTDRAATVGEMSCSE